MNFEVYDEGYMPTYLTYLLGLIATTWAVLTFARPLSTLKRGSGTWKQQPCLRALQEDNNLIRLLSSGRRRCNDVHFLA